MRINWIKITGFKDKERVIELKFSETPITVLYGDNGCGKTTLLRVLHALFTQNENELIAENIQEIEIEIQKPMLCIGKKYVIVREDIWRANENKYKHLKFEKLMISEQRYLWEKFSWDVRTLLFGVGRGISHNVSFQPEQIERFFHSSLGENYRRRFGIRDIYHFSEELASYLQKVNVNSVKINRSFGKMDEINKKNAKLDGLMMNTIESLLIQRYNLAETRKMTRVQNALFSTLSKIICEEKPKEKLQFDIDIFRNQLIDNRQKLLAAIKDISENELQKQLIDILSNDDIEEILSECQNNKLLMTLLVNMMNELDKDEEILASISTIVRIFNEHINNDKELVIDKNGARIQFKKTKDSHNLSNLSSGERHLLSFLTICILNGQSRDIVMIDEPELSLNGKWKRSLLDELQKLLPNTQIIVATHSTTIVDGKFNALSKLV